MDPFSRAAGAPTANPDIQRDKERGGYGPQIEELRQLALSMFEVGDVKMSARTTDSPDGKWMIADGREVSTAEYPEYAEAVGTAFNVGDEAVGNVRLPNLSRRMPVGLGDHATLPDIALGSKGGAETVSLAGVENGAHGHPTTSITNNLLDSYSTLTGIQGGGSGKAIGSMNFKDFTHSHGISNAGQGSPHENMPAYLGVPFLVRMRP